MGEIYSGDSCLSFNLSSHSCLYFFACFAAHFLHWLSGVFLLVRLLKSVIGFSILQVVHVFVSVILVEEYVCM